MTASDVPRSRRSSSASRRRRTSGSSSWRREMVDRRMCSTSSKTADPACSVITWPSSEPSSRTSAVSGSRAPAVPIPPGSGRTATVGVDDASARPRRRGVAVMRPDIADRTGSQPFPVRNLSRSRRCVGLPGDGHPEGPSRHGPAARPEGRGRWPCARPAALPPPGPAARDDRADLGRAARDRRRRDPRCPPRRRVLPLPGGSRRSVPDARRNERPRPLPDRPGARPVRGGRHRPGRRLAAAAGHPGRQGGSRGSCGCAASTSAASWPRCCRCR